ncbi:toprim domain-containing protein [Salinibacter altiplanensis]|uniref:toprim domain-containing protein n=1 Tax=Salinibacter altiplanensis TaxID=1803181 RepID=UPI001E4D2B2B|nr:toprim domain-containing protein [Salinibacter altiplanensis]
MKGNDTALFNAGAIATASGGDSFDPADPLVICEGPFDALSFIEAGWERTVALHNTKGVPWDALRGNAETLVFAFDVDPESETGQTDAPKRAHEATRRGFDAHTLHDEDSYAGHNDPNDALQAGELTLGYLEEIGTEAVALGGDGAAEGGGEDRRFKNKPHDRRGSGPKNNPCSPDAEGSERLEDEGGTEADQPPTTQATGGEVGRGTYEPADLAEYWNGTDVGHLGRWLWERGGVPEGDVGAGLYADRELHVWIEEKLEAGSQGTSEQTKTRLRWVLWRLYAEHGPEEVPEGQIPVPPMRRA